VILKGNSPVSPKVRSTGPRAKTGKGRRRRKMKINPASGNHDLRYAIPEVLTVHPLVL
jgi:hypothetical protein